MLSNEHYGCKYCAKNSQTPKTVLHITHLKYELHCDNSKRFEDVIYAARFSNISSYLACKEDCFTFKYYLDFSGNYFPLRIVRS